MIRTVKIVKYIWTMEKANNNDKAVMQCSNIANAIGSNHQCTQHKVERDKRSHMIKFSTKNPKDNEFLSYLYQRMHKKTLAGGQRSWLVITKIEQKLGSKFVCCSHFKNLINKQVCQLIQKQDDEKKTYMSSVKKK